MEKYCISRDYTIKEAVECIEENNNRIVLVLNENKKVIGVISQGDIIRALLAGKNFYTRIDDIIRSDFLYQKEKDMEGAYKLFRKRKITLLPIVDDEFRLVDIITMDDIYCFMEEK
ncbi:MAG: CBS domain-containing protein [Lachnospiraceae bacterium]|nr:CBS domain-containing protein [Lachnospiraceae bacterium]